MNTNNSHSHGVIRVPYYVEWVKVGKVVPNQHLKVVFENDAIAVADGRIEDARAGASDARPLQQALPDEVEAALRDAGDERRLRSVVEVAVGAGLL